MVGPIGYRLVTLSDIHPVWSGCEKRVSERASEGHPRFAKETTKQKSVWRRPLPTLILRRFRVPSGKSMLVDACAAFRRCRESCGRSTRQRGRAKAGARARARAGMKQTVSALVVTQAPGRIEVLITRVHTLNRSRLKSYVNVNSAPIVAVMTCYARAVSPLTCTTTWSYLRSTLVSD